MPDVSIAGDMITGFCGETDADHQASKQLLRDVGYKSLFIFKYSSRSGTVAHRRLSDDIPEAIKKDRIAELLTLQSKLGLSHHRSFIGNELEVLVESESKLKGNGVQLGWQQRRQDGEAANVPLIGRSRGDEIVAFSGPRTAIGTIVRVRAEDATPLSVKAALVPSSLDLLSENGN